MRSVDHQRPPQPRLTHTWNPSLVLQYAKKEGHSEALEVRPFVIVMSQDGSLHKIRVPRNCIDSFIVWGGETDYRHWLTFYNKTEMLVRLLLETLVARLFPLGVVFGVGIASAKPAVQFWSWQFWRRSLSWPWPLCCEIWGVGCDQIEFDQSNGVIIIFCTL